MLVCGAVVATRRDAREVLSFRRRRELSVLAPRLVPCCTRGRVCPHTVSVRGAGVPARRGARGARAVPCCTRTRHSCDVVLGSKYV